MSRDPRIDSYIAKSAPFAQEILGHVRDRVHAVLPDAEESIKWGMPAYLAGGKLLLITAAFKAHTALNFWRGQDLGSNHDTVGMGQFGKIKSIGELPSDAQLDQLIRDAAALAQTAPAPRKAKAPKPASEMHPDFANALATTPAAKVHFDGFPPSAQRDYRDWISEAKQDATRARRIATAIEWISEGKRRNWKYENC